MMWPETTTPCPACTCLWFRSYCTGRGDNCRSELDGFWDVGSVVAYWGVESAVGFLVGTLCTRLIDCLLASPSTSGLGVSRCDLDNASASSLACLLVSFSEANRCGCSIESALVLLVDDTRTCPWGVCVTGCFRRTRRGLEEGEVGASMTLSRGPLCIRTGTRPRFFHDHDLVRTGRRHASPLSQWLQAVAWPARAY